jgi:alkylation response protein AidB-like acyl-CoA dehydrogenase
MTVVLDDAEVDLVAVRDGLAPLFDAIAANAPRHETAGTQPYDEVRRLQQAGFGALRVRSADGGGGLSLEQLFALLIELGAADSNLPQIYRNHLAFVEDKRLGAEHERWRGEIVGGAFFGGAWSEVTGDSLSELSTTVEPEGDGYRLSGRKYYATGSLFADWISVLATSGPEQFSLVLVPADAPGVELREDWTGIGQRQTGSGSAFFTAVSVPASDVYPFSERVAYQEAFYQLVHLATLGGIARAAHRDLVEALRRRTRAYPAGLSRVPREDPQYHEVVGRVGALASSVEASVRWAARQLDELEPVLASAAEQATKDERLRRATISVYEAQLTVTDATLEAATILYDALGSSALDRSTQLDRHWRNARTLTSHNPRIYKARIVGDWHVNGTDPIAALWRGVDHPEPGTERTR